MTCRVCGRLCQGERCASCEREQDLADADAAGAYEPEWYDCPTCGLNAAAPGQRCYRCRGEA